MPPRPLVFKPRTVGILGGGQLARMLAEAALRLGLRPVAYAEEADCPASGICADVVVGKIEDSKRLRDFVARASVVVFENEFVDCRRLRASTEAPEAKFFPGLPAIETLQDKLEQKRLLTRIGVPTSPFVALDPNKDARAEIRRALDEQGGGVVLKWSRLGYDGKGVRMVADVSEIEAALPFCQAAAARAIPLYAERRIDFSRELALVAVTSIHGPGVNYPLVISEQDGGICKRVLGPAISLGVPPEHQIAAAEAARKIAVATGLCGSFGIEFFESRSGGILVNEIAPRVHNTGHYTQNAFPASQFENHWRAVLGLPLFDPAAGAIAPFFAMLNLLGPAGISLESGDHPLPVPGEHSHLHWYAKRGIRPGRKLGHLNGVARSAEDLKALLNELEKCEKRWIEELRKEPE